MVVVTFPKFAPEVEILAAGLPKFAWLKALNASKRVSILYSLAMGKLLNRLKSTVSSPGPCNALGRHDPKVPSVGAEKATPGVGLMKNPGEWVPANCRGSLDAPVKGLPTQFAYDALFPPVSLLFVAVTLNG